MGIPENLYACAVCEESFSIAKSLVNHVNENHVSLPSSVELKQENYSKVVKSLPSSIDNIEHQKENNTKVEKIELEKEETKRLRIVKSLPSSIKHQKKNETKVDEIKLEEEEINEPKNNRKKFFINIANHASVPSSVKLKMENYNKEVERQMENDTKVDVIKTEKKETKGRKNNQQRYSINIDSKIVKEKL